MDVLRFRMLLAQARAAQLSGDQRAELGLLEESLRLWRGPALADVPSASLQATVVPRLTEERLMSAERRLDLLIETGRSAEAVGELTEICREHPFGSGPGHF